MCVFFVGCGTQNPPSEISQKNELRTSIPMQSIFYERQIFLDAMHDINEKNIKQTQSNIAIVPHHLLASDIIAGTLSALKNNNVQRVYIIGPNHDDLSGSTISSAHLSYQAPNGTVDTDTKMTNKFLDDLELHPLTDPFINEHSIGAIIPFVAELYPNAHIIPIVYNSSATLEDIELVAHWLDKNTQKNDTIIFSIDFSHYLTQLQANTNDQKTIQYMTQLNAAAINELNNAFVDSPASLATALTLAKIRNLTPHIQYHKNSNDYTIKKHRETTSYFGVLFK